jgi:hypothetical protein
MDYFRFSPRRRVWLGSNASNRAIPAPSALSRSRALMARASIARALMARVLMAHGAVMARALMARALMARALMARVLMAHGAAVQLWNSGENSENSAS